MDEQHDQHPARREGDPDRPLSDALRSAVSRTLDATSGSAVETRQRAGELLDEVARRGQEAGEEIARRGNEARDEIIRRRNEAGGELKRRLREIGFATADDLEALERRVAELEARAAGTDPDPRPQV